MAVLIRYHAVENQSWIMEAGRPKTNSEKHSSYQCSLFAYLFFFFSLASNRRPLVPRPRTCVSAGNINCLVLRLSSHILGRDNVEGPYYEYSGRNMYDIRRSSNEKVVSDFFVQFLNLPSTQDALGIEQGFQYKMSSNEVYAAFQQSGDYIFSEPLEDISYLLTTGVRVVYVEASPGASESQLTIFSQTYLWRCRLYWQLV